MVADSHSLNFVSSSCSLGTTPARSYATPRFVYDSRRDGGATLVTSGRGRGDQVCERRRVNEQKEQRSTVEALSARIREARGERGLTQDEVARRVGVTVRAYQRWEEGASMPHRRNLDRLREVLGVDRSEPPHIEGPVENRFDRLEELVQQSVIGEPAPEERARELAATWDTHERVERMERMLLEVAEAVKRREEAFPTEAVERLSHLLEQLGFRRPDQHNETGRT
jgi:transcriptional regulator with XRE-family HTH domain